MYEIKDIIHIVSSVLEIPVIVVLIVMGVKTIFELGTFLYECLFVRFRLEKNPSQIIEQIDKISKQKLEKFIDDTNLISQHKKQIIRIIKSKLKGENLKILSLQILSEEEERSAKKVYWTDIITRTAPMFGLMATLIPLGPGLIALGKGDTKILAGSLLSAFDATVLGLIIAAVAFMVSKIRKNWYLFDINAFEAIIDKILNR